jgi:hypothetical protein
MAIMMTRFNLVFINLALVALLVRQEPLVVGRVLT